MGTDWTARAESLWAKTGDAPEDWLSLPRHLEDAAAIAPYLWDDWLVPGIKEWLDDELGLESDGAALLAWLAGVHDVGKCSPSFQAQLVGRPDMAAFADRVVEAGLPLGPPLLHDERYPHSAASANALERWLPSAVPEVGRRGAKRLAEIVGAHHGLPARSRPKKAAAVNVDESWRTVQAELLSRLTEQTGAEPVLKRLNFKRMRRPHQMVLTGLVIIADWIASNQDLFLLNPSSSDSSAERAADAWRALDLPAPWMLADLPTDPVSAFRQRFDWPEGRIPWPVQQHAVEAARSLAGPGLICVEAPMGVGKTEAALVAAEELARRTGRCGFMIAAPTMATSDALFTRVGAWARRAGAAGPPASLFLAHSKASLNRDVAALPRRGLGTQSVGVDEEGTTGNVVAHQWLSGRKKGLLSTIAVGTIDQVLLMALQARHAMLRHVALASKVVVIDECHAYTAYMNRYLGRALHWLGAYGVPVVLLSATLPHAVKVELIDAYRGGLTGKKPEANDVPRSGLAYPVLTLADEAGVRVQPAPESGRRQQVRVEPLGEDAAALESVMCRVAEEGGCLLVVCNTVARAQQSYLIAQRLVGDEARLLHARFTVAQRLEKEQELLDDLGPTSRRGAGRPERRILVATQVVEQSLDLDFDAMVTDVAPVDLVLQRAGRVHRHRRPAEDRPEWAQRPRVWVRGVETFGDQASAPVFQASQEYVYARAALLATVGVLSLQADGTTVNIPQDIPKLVSDAYDGRPPLPDGWRDDWEAADDEWQAKQKEQRDRAESFLLPAPREGSGDFESLWPVDSNAADTAKGEAAGLAQVRDSEPTLEVLLTRTVPGGYQPLTAEPDLVVAQGRTPSWALAHEIALSSVRLPRRFSRPTLFERALDELERDTDAAWQHSSLLKGQLQLSLDEQGRVQLAGQSLRYDLELGLVEEKQA